jgi:hypothetical protein
MPTGCDPTGIWRPLAPGASTAGRVTLSERHGPVAVAAGDPPHATIVEARTTMTSLDTDAARTS